MRRTRVRTARLRRFRGRRAQVSAVGTVLALLLFVSFLSTFVFGQLPSQMTQVEFVHELQVENQMLRLQSAVTAESANPSVPVTLTIPVTLGSASYPPFGVPSSGTIQPATSAIRTVFGLALKGSTSTVKLPMTYLGGLTTHLNNRYIAPADVAYDLGAVILGQQDGGSVMLSPPSLSYTVVTGGVDLNLTLVSVLSNVSAVSGYASAPVLTSVESATTFSQSNNGANGYSLASPLYLNVTTNYPQAWATYFNAMSAVVPNGASCVPGPRVTTADCYTPPYGDYSTVVVPFVVTELTVVSVVAYLAVY